MRRSSNPGVVVAAISKEAAVEKKAASAKTKARAALTVRRKSKEDFKDAIAGHLDALADMIGRNVVLELISTDVDPKAGFANFRDRVKHWITINEPLQTAVNGYGVGIFAPGVREDTSIEPYLAAHHQLLAHAAAYAVYKEKFKATQGGEVGLVLDCEWAEAFSDKEEDKIATERRLDFQLGWYLDPIFYGDYPAVMRQRLGDKLPKLSEKDKELPSNAIDFVGLNHYTSRFISHVQKPRGIHFYQVQEMERIAKWNNGEVIGDKAASEWLYIVPWGIRRTLNYIATRYRNPKIYVTENGMDEEDSEISTLSEALNDTKRVGYFKGYIAAVAQAIR
uniref:Beta-glucosidase 42 n=1 Tax=Ananas comosus var. bracteatus TaxID=296719 RepID=A0A6V7PXX0_ANACO|nr:unnamed protein product [Ananas comosus var. bracteatus]